MPMLPSLKPELAMVLETLRNAESVELVRALMLYAVGSRRYDRIPSEFLQVARSGDIPSSADLPELQRLAKELDDEAALSDWREGGDSKSADIFEQARLLTAMFFIASGTSGERLDRAVYELAYASGNVDRFLDEALRMARRIVTTGKSHRVDQGG